MSVAIAGLAPQSSAVPNVKPRSVSESAFLFKLFLTALAIGIFIQTLGPAWLVKLFQVNHSDPTEISAILFGSVIVSVILHELGHLVAALCMGFQVSQITVGPLRFARSHGSRKLQYSRKLFSGSVGAIPADLNQWRARMLVVVLGGPLVSGSLFIIAAYLANTWHENAFAVAFLKGLALINLFITVLGLIPNSADAAVRNDARLFLTLLANGNDAEQMRLYHLVTQLQISGARPSSYPQELIARLVRANGNADLKLFSANAIYLWALDSGDMVTADVWDRHAQDLMQENHLRLSNSALAESACFDVLHRNNPAAALQKIRAIKFQSLSPWLAQRTKAAQRLAEGKLVDASAHLEKARSSFSSLSPYFDFETSLLAMFQQKIQKGIGSGKLAKHAVA